jgi:integrase
MTRTAPIKLPFVNSNYRYGRWHYEFRRGAIRLTIRGRPGSAKWYRHYSELLAESEEAAKPVSGPAKPGTVDAIIIRYVKSDAFKALAPSTQAQRRRILDHFADFKTPSGRAYGHARLRTMRKENVEAVLAGKPVTSKRDCLKALRHWLQFAKDAGEVDIDVTAGIKTAKPATSTGYPTWTDDGIELYRQCHPVGSMARCAIELLLNTAARRGDAHILGRLHLRDGVLTWRPQKTSRSTGRLLSVPVVPELAAAINALPATNEVTFLLTAHGRPFASAAAFGNRFADWCRQAGLQPVMCDDGKLRDYRAHGLRKAACMRLAEADCTAPQIMAVSGHKTLAEAQKYIDAVNQKKMAKAAMDKLAAGSKPVRQVTEAPSVGRKKGAKH